MKKFLVLTTFMLGMLTVSAFSQTRVVVLPFTNMDGNAAFNVWCYKLQDSLAKSMIASEQNGKDYIVVPMDSVEAVMAELNVDPANPQYASDMWRAVEKLNVEKVITGTFQYKRDRFLINAYIYYVDTKIPMADFQERNLFKPEAKIYETIPVITRTLTKAFVKQ